MKRSNYNQYYPFYIISVLLILFQFPSCKKVDQLNYTKRYSIRIDKRESILFLLENRIIIKKAYPVVFGANFRHDKEQEGDWATPEGIFYIREIVYNPGGIYGSRSFLLNYPNKEDAERGFSEGLISSEEYHKILNANTKGEIPPQTTNLGGLIRIHGGGLHKGKNWTQGCVAMDDMSASELNAYIELGTMVEILPYVKPPGDADGDGLPNGKDILAGAKLCVANAASYTEGYYQLPYPYGDMPATLGVCTDVIIRSFRNAGIDLQKLIHEDILSRPAAYNLLKRYGRADPDKNIDHRRVKNLIIFLRKHARIITTSTGESSLSQWQPGDIVVFDTIASRKGGDHIGIVSDSKSDEGLPLVINNWTNGYRTSEMNLLKNWPVTNHFRY